MSHLRNQVGLLTLPGLELQTVRGVLALPALRPWLMRAVLAASDVAALCLAALITIEGWHAWDPRLNPADYLPLWPFLFVFVAAYAAAGLYEGSEVNPVQELKRCTVSACLSFATLAVASFLSKQAEAYSRASFLLALVQSIVYVPLLRNYLRQALAAKVWWGHAAVVIGAGETGRRIVTALRRHPEFGLKPVAVLDDRPEKGHVAGVPVTGGVKMAPVLAHSGVRYAIIAQPELSRKELLEVFSRSSEVFTHVLLVPDLLGMSSLWVETADLGGLLSLRIRQNLLLPGSRILKKCLDRGLAFITALVAAPLIAIIAAIMTLTSPGPVFYSQRRLGRAGRAIRVWKFRTMVPDAEAVLAGHLSRDAELRREWEQEHKLRKDPRVTAIGSFLRGTSLDELPQLWNVLKGEMSLVGPRPIVEAEISKYGPNYDLYTRVTPGITGLWQVSGRNDVTYGERVSLDVYYVRNWSVWLDVYILARTIRVVLFRKGAY